MTLFLERLLLPITHVLVAWLVVVGCTCAIYAGVHGTGAWRVSWQQRGRTFPARQSGESPPAPRALIGDTSDTKANRSQAQAQGDI